LEKKKFYTSDRGRIVNSFLEHFFLNYVEYGFTADLENSLDDISSGKVDWHSLLASFWDKFHKNVDEVAAKSTIEVIDVINQDLSEHFFGGQNKPCPQCGDGHMTIRAGKFGIFASCSKYPECKHTSQIDDLIEKGEESGEDDGPELGPIDLGNFSESGEKMELKKGPYGQYLETKKDDKTIRSALPKFLKIEQLDSKVANLLLSMPRKITSLDGKDVSIVNGRFGIYLSCDSKSFALPQNFDILDISPEQALEFIKQSGKSEPFAIHPESKKEIFLLKGKFGPYLKYDSKNYAIPKKILENLSSEDAIKLIDEKDSASKAK
jgi:DNA topoisomerase-1